MKHIIKIKVLYENNKFILYFNSKPFIKHIKIYSSENNSFAFTDGLSFNPVKYWGTYLYWQPVAMGCTYWFSVFKACRGIYL